jgi:prepilin-type N-terminal cleavage/methylation domain-containing protein
MKKQKGFSLIELLIVVAIILIIAAIAVPNLLRSRMAANEASAAGSLRSVATANVTYSTTYNQGFAGDLNHLAPPAAPPATSDAADLLDATLAGCLNGCNSNTSTKSGYVFTYLPGVAVPTPATPNPTYSTASTPVTAGSTGQSTFCVDQTNVVMKDTSGTAVAGATTGCVTGDFVVGGTIGPM